MVRFLLSALLISFASTASAECIGENILNTMPKEDRELVEALAANTPYPEGNLWLAKKGNSALHVIGTIHIYTPGMNNLVAHATPLVENADGVFFEILAAEEDRMKQMMLSDPEIGFIVDGPTLPQLLNKDEWDLLSSEMKARGVPGFLTAKMKPWQIALTLGVPPCAMADVVEQNGVDYQLRRSALAADTPMFALDNLDDLMELLAGGTMEEQLEDLRLALPMLQDSTPMFVTTLETFVSERNALAWELGKHLAIQNAGEAGERLKSEFEEMEVELLINRNLKWMEKLLPAISDGSYVIAVGAAHLPGEQGILKLLENNGYTLTPVVH